MRLSFKEMCARFDVTPRTLRYYEYIELLFPEREGRSRFYGARDVARMTLILRGRRFGFSLEELRQWLALYESGGEAAQAGTFLAVVRTRVAELQADRDAIEAIITEMQELEADLRARGFSETDADSQTIIAPTRDPSPMRRS